MTWLWWAIPLALVVFPWKLNSFLSGALKYHGFVFLSAIIVVLWLVAWLVSGWQLALLAALGTPLISALWKPLAWRIACRANLIPELGYDLDAFRSNECDWEDIVARIEAMSGEGGLRGKIYRFQQADKARLRQVTVTNAAKSPAVDDVLATCGASIRDLFALYDQVEIVSLPARFRRKVLRNPHLVRYFLENSEPEEEEGVLQHDGHQPSGEYGRAMVPRDKCVVLRYWAVRYPSGRMP
jgi:hypothetical protein